jgi:hypothetical protein
MESGWHFGMSHLFPATTNIPPPFHFQHKKKTNPIRIFFPTTFAHFWVPGLKFCEWQLQIANQPKMWDAKKGRKNIV